MRFVAGMVVMASLVLPAGATMKHKKTTATSTTAHSAAMDPTRATEIQTALVKQGYLTGEPTGKWDATSVAAMQKLQSDNGWQTKFTPDARALAKLGLAGSAGDSAQVASGPADAGSN